MFQSPIENAFTIGTFSVKMYGVCMFLAILTGIFVTYFVAKKHYKQVNLEVLSDVFFPVVILGIIFARLYYVVLDLKYYLKNTNEIMAIWLGGISIHGAMIGGIIGAISYLKIKKEPILPYLDSFSYGVILAQAVGRLGNFFNSEAFGLPTNLPWKLYIAPMYRPMEYIDVDFFHPTFLYEMILNVMIFFILYFVIRKLAKNISGIVFFSYLALYSVARILVESVRIDSVLNILDIPIAKIASFLILAISIFAILFLLKKSKTISE